MHPCWQPQSLMDNGSRPLTKYEEQCRALQCCAVWLTLHSSALQCHTYQIWRNSAERCSVAYNTVVHCTAVSMIKDVTHCRRWAMQQEQGRLGTMGMLGTLGTRLGRWGLWVCWGRCVIWQLLHWVVFAWGPLQLVMGPSFFAKKTQTIFFWKLSFLNCVFKTFLSKLFLSVCCVRSLHCMSCPGLYWCCCWNFKQLLTSLLRWAE